MFNNLTTLFFKRNFSPALLLLLFALAPAVGLGQTANRALGTSEPFEVIETEAGAGDFTHTYQLTPGRGRAVRLVVEQLGADVSGTVYAPGGEKLCFSDSPNGFTGPEPLFFVAEEEGEY